MEDLAEAVVLLLQYGWPASFLVLYDEVWLLIQQASNLMKNATGNVCNMDVLAWYVDPNCGDSGFSPHRDRQPDDSPATFRADGSAMYSTCWIPFTHATPENSCLYVIPRHADPGYFEGDPEEEDAPDPLTRALQNKEAYQHIRALPAEPGSAVIFTHRIVHWGSKGHVGYPVPRISMSFGCADDAYEPPYFSREHLPSPPLALRLALAAAQMFIYHERFPMTPKQVAFYHEAFTSQSAAFDPSYRKKVMVEFVAASKEAAAGVAGKLKATIGAGAGGANRRPSAVASKRGKGNQEEEGLLAVEEQQQRDGKQQQQPKQKKRKMQQQENGVMEAPAGRELVSQEQKVLRKKSKAGLTTAAAADDGDGPLQQRQEEADDKQLKTKKQKQSKQAQAAAADADDGPIQQQEANGKQRKKKKQKQSKQAQAAAGAATGVGSAAAEAAGTRVLSRAGAGAGAGGDLEDDQEDSDVMELAMEAMLDAAMAEDDLDFEDDFDGDDDSLDGDLGAAGGLEGDKEQLLAAAADDDDSDDEEEPEYDEHGLAHEPKKLKQQQGSKVAAAAGGGRGKVKDAGANQGKKVGKEGELVVDKLAVGRGIKRKAVKAAAVLSGSRSEKQCLKGRKKK